MRTVRKGEARASEDVNSRGGAAWIEEEWIKGKVGLGLSPSDLTPTRD